MNIRILFSAVAMSTFAITSAIAQLNVGSSTAPSSTLQVNGSFAPNFTSVTSSTYTLGSDFFVAFNGSSPSMYTLPIAISGSGNFKGRQYTIKNNTPAQVLTVFPAASETINGSSSIIIPAGYVLTVVNTGATSGASWLIVGFSPAIAVASTLGSAIYLKATTNTVVDGTNIFPLNLGSTIYNSGDFSYDPSSNNITVNQAGTYMASMQVGWTDIASGEQLTIGVVDVASSKWIGRGSTFASFSLSSASSSIVQLQNYTCPIVVTKGQILRFSILGANVNSKVVPTETGTTGTGIVTSALLQRVSN